MATLDPLVIEIQARDLTNAAFKKVAKNARLVSNEMKMIGSTKLNIATAWNKNFEEIGRTVKSVTTGFSKFKMEFLSTMFLGMAMQRAFGGALKGAYATFSKIAEGTDLANNKINQLNAAWEFFKFSLIDALMNSAFFKVLIDGIIVVVDWFGQLGDKDKGLIGGILIGLWAIGTVSYIGSTLILGLNGINTMLVNAGKEALTLKGTLGAIGGAIAITYAVREAVDAYDEIKNGKFVAGVLSAISSALTGIGGLKMVTGKAGGGALIAVGLAIQLVQTDAFFNAIKLVVNLLGATMMTAGDYIGHLFADGFKNAMFNGVIDAIQFVVSKLSILPGMEYLLKPFNKVINQLQTRMTGQTPFDAGAAFKENYDFLRERGANAPNPIDMLFGKVDDLLASQSQGSETPIVIQNNYYTPSDGTSLASMEIVSQRNLNEQLSRYGQGTY